MRHDNDTATTNSTSYLTTLNEDILRAEEEGDKDAIAPHLHENFTIIRATGIRQNREEFLKAVPANVNRGRSAETPKIYPYGDCAVVAVQVSTSKNADGTETLKHYWNTRVFVRQDDEWRCVSWQVTEISKP
jgi:hypothetical protein